MATGQDATYSGASKVYIKQQPQGTTLNGNTITTEEVTDTGGLQSQFGLSALNGQMLPAKIGFTVAGFGAGGSKQVQVTIQVQDNGGQPISGIPWDLDVILSDVASGTGITAATMASYNVTTGTILNTYSASKALYIQTDATGKIVINFGIAAAPQIYVMVQAGGQPVPSVGSVPPSSYS